MGILSHNFLEVSLIFGEGIGADIVAVLYILCGLGIFLYGINRMGSSLKSIAGDKMRVIIEKSTNTPLKGMLVGFAATMLTQSASGTSAIIVSLVASGLMTFSQAIGVLLGANIGGTVLTIILAIFSQLKIMPIVSVGLVFVGAFVTFFFKDKKVNQIGSVVLGFGFIFLGLAFIDMSFGHFLDNPTYKGSIESIFETISSIPVLGILVGTVFTFIVQSSSATIGIVQEMFASGSVSLFGALAVMLGANVGTTVTALLASLGSTRSAKKVAITNTLIKVFGVFWFGVCFRWAFYPIVDLVMKGFGWETNPMIIALAHLGFNVINSFVILFLIKPSVFVINKMFPDDEVSIEDHLLDYSLIKKSPSLALSFVKSAVCYMANEMKEYVHLVKNYAFERNDKEIERGAELERSINCLDKRIHDYLIKLTITKIDDQTSTRLSKYLDQIKDIERIGDHCTNILEFFKDRYEKELTLSDDGKQDLESMFATLLAMTDGTIESIETWDVLRAEEASLYENQIDQLEEVLHERHVHRVNSGYCTFANTEHYVEILSNIERMGDHLMNILESIITKEYCKYDEYNH